MADGRPGGEPRDRSEGLTVAGWGGERERARHDVHAAVTVLREWRTADEEVVPLVADRLSDPDPGTKKLAISILAGFGTLASNYADSIFDALHASNVEDQDLTEAAVWALSAVRDPRCVPPVARLLLTGKFSYRVLPVYFPEEFEGFDLPTLAEVLIPLRAHAGELLPPILRLLAAEDSGCRVREQLLAVLESWGPAAGSAVGEVVSLLGRGENLDIVVARVIAAIAPHDLGPVIDELDRYLSRNGPAALEMAYTRWRISGDPQPALSVLGAAVGAGQGFYVRHLARMGRSAENLVPVVRSLLGQRLMMRVEAANALWRMSGSISEEVVAVMLEALKPLAFGWWRPFVTPALRYVAEMGPEARAAETVLTPTLKSPRRLLGLNGGWRKIAEDLELNGLSRTALAAVRDDRSVGSELE